MSYGVHRFVERHCSLNRIITLFRTIIIFALIFLAACDNKSSPENEKADVIARAFDQYLLREEINELVPEDVHGQDSLNMVKSYIDNWVKQQVVLHNAEKNLDDENKNVEKQLEEYRNSLIMYAYERELVSQQLDTTVSIKEIEDFYNLNKNNFELKSNIIKVIYLKLNKKSPKLNKVREWYKSGNPRDRQLLSDYAHQYALNYYLDDKSWLFFDDLIKEIPIKTYDQEQFLRNNRNIEIEDSTLIYLVSIKGFMVKNSLSPLSFEINNIRNMIINQRKLQLVEEMEQKAFEAARKSGDIEIY